MLQASVRRPSDVLSDVLLSCSGWRSVHMKIEAALFSRLIDIRLLMFNVNARNPPCLLSVWMFYCTPALHAPRRDSFILPACSPCVFNYRGRCVLTCLQQLSIAVTETCSHREEERLSGGAAEGGRLLLNLYQPGPSLGLFKPPPCIQHRYSPCRDSLSVVWDRTFMG